MTTWDGASSWLVMVVLIVFSMLGLVSLIFMALRAEFAPWKRGTVDPSVTDPRELLALQLARGDIDTDEYLKRVDALARGHDVER
jgi:uncharacterized membrane protein